MPEKKDKADCDLFKNNYICAHYERRVLDNHVKNKK